MDRSKVALSRRRARITAAKCLIPRNGGRGRTIAMCDQPDDTSTNGLQQAASLGTETSRRSFLQAGAGALAGAAALPATALAQGAGAPAADAELGRLQGA